MQKMQNYEIKFKNSICMNKMIQNNFYAILVWRKIFLTIIKMHEMQYNVENYLTMQKLENCDKNQG